MTAQTTDTAPELNLGAVVVGGSAGSLDPLLTVLERLPRGFGMPIAVVIHTPKDPPSGLVEALSHRSSLPVREPIDKEPLEAGTVFVAPPGYHLLVGRGPCFAFSVDPPENFSRPSIDVLFESALDVYGARLVAVVLSGANNDGGRGLAAVCQAGGLALVQAPEEATSPEMPRAALEACPAAAMLSARDIAERLVTVVAERESEMRTA
jgi:two-component system chemotaxis response regulator CheB